MAGDDNLWRGMLAELGTVYDEYPAHFVGAVICVIAAGALLVLAVL
jgi:hypothetical protein